MSLSAPGLQRPLGAGTRAYPVGPITWVRSYFFTDGRRTIQTWLALIWLLDGALQFQSYMYGSGFIQMLKATAVGQPPWLGDSITWAASAAQAHQAAFNTLFALVQVMIGIGLLNRRWVKPALVASFAWSLIIWWFGEGFGMLFMTMLTPLSGAPGAAFLYLLVGAIAWPNQRPGGLLGVRGARVAWGVLWLVMAWLWLSAAGSSPNGISEAINGAPSGIGLLTAVQSWFTTATNGHGLALGLALAALSAAIGIAVWRGRRARGFLALSVLLNLVYWILGQGLGGIFAGGATDPNSAPLFILLAYALYTLVPVRIEHRGRSELGT